MGTRRCAAAVALSVMAMIGVGVLVGAGAGFAAGGEGTLTLPITEELPGSFSFGFAPKKLPAEGSAGLELKADLEVPPPSSGGPGPVLTTAIIGLDKAIALEPRGLPVCHWGPQIDAAGTLCPRTSAVGKVAGSFEIDFPEEAPQFVSGEGRIYNGGIRNGVTDLMLELPLGGPVSGLLHLIVPVRPVAEGRIGSEATITLPEVAGGSGALRELRLHLHRVFRRDGERINYVSAGCTDGKLDTTFEGVFSDGTKWSEKAIRPCTPAL